MKMKLYTAAALSRVLGMKESEIKALTRKGIIQATNTGLYDIEQSARAIIAIFRNPEAQRQITDYQSERAQYMRTKRQNAEYDLMIKEGRLHTSEDLERVLSALLVNFKARIRSIPARVSPQAAKMASQEDIFDLLKQETDEALQELSDVRNVLSGAPNNEERNGQGKRNDA